MIEVGLGIGQIAPPQGADPHEEIPLPSPRLVLSLKETPQDRIGIGGSVSGKEIAGSTLGRGSRRRGKGGYDGQGTVTGGKLTHVYSPFRSLLRE
jgi:hypothetical protein